MNEQSAPLPRLPPLNTRESFLERARSNTSEVAIGWTPVQGEPGRTPKTPVPVPRMPPPPMVNSRTQPRNSQLPAEEMYRSPFVTTAAPITPVLSPDNFYRYMVSKTPSDSVSATAPNSKSPSQKSVAMRPLPPPLWTMRNSSQNSSSVQNFYSGSHYTFNNSNARSNSYSSLLGGKPLPQAPSITAPTQPFMIEALDENKLYQCYTVYKLSDIYEWILKIYFEWFNECVFEKINFFQIVQLLLEFQMPASFDQDTIDSNVDKILKSLIYQNAVRFEWDGDQEIAVVVAGLEISGIMTELLSCYSFFDSIYGLEENKDFCYAFTCPHRYAKEQRQEIKLSELINKSVGLWTEYWKITPEEIAEINPKEVQKQSFIFDLIVLEERSLNIGNAATQIYGREFDSWLLPDEPNFASLAFDIFQPLIQIHKDYVLSPIFWKIKTRGKFIDGIGKIYLKWCHEAREAYLRYAVAMATVHEVISWEKQNSTPFALWLIAIDNTPEITRSKLYHDVIFFGGFFKTLQNLPITLSSILKNTDPSVEDYEYLTMAIADVEKLNSDVDKLHGDAVDKRRLVRFSRQLILGSNGILAYANVGPKSKDTSENGFNNVVANSDDTKRDHKKNINGAFNAEHLHQTDTIKRRLLIDEFFFGLSDPERRLVMSGNALKKRDLWLEPTPVYIVLLDNCFLITEETSKSQTKRFKLIERPIPIEYLNLEKRRDPSEITKGTNSFKSLALKDLKGDTSTHVSPMVSVRPTLKNAAKSIYSSAAPYDSKKTAISNALPNNMEYAFKVRNSATTDSYTFQVSSKEELNIWTNSFISCFKVKSKSLGDVPFKFDILSTQFAYMEKNAPVNLSVAPEGSDLDLAMRKYSQTTFGIYEHGTGNTIVAKIYTTLHMSVDSRIYLLVATNSGILMRNLSDAKTGFFNVLQCSEAKRLEVNTKLGLLLVLDGKRLCYFNLASIIGAYYDATGLLPDKKIVGVVVDDKVGYFKIAEDFANSRHLIYERKNRIILMTPEFDHISKVFKHFKLYKEYKITCPGNTLTSLEIEDIVTFKKCFLVCTSKNVVMFHDSFGDEGFLLPSFRNDVDIGKHGYANPFKSVRDPSSSMAKRAGVRYSRLEEVQRNISGQKARPVTCLKVPFSDIYLIVYDEAVLKINKYGEVCDWKIDIMVLDFCCTGATMCNFYLILFGDNLFQIYNLKELNRKKLTDLLPVQIFNGKKIQLVSSEKTGKATMVLSHPKITNRQLLLELIAST